MSIWDFIFKVNSRFLIVPLLNEVEQISVLTANIIYKHDN